MDCHSGGKMGRRYRKKTSNEGMLFVIAAIFVIWLIGTVVRVIGENMYWIKWTLLIILIGFLMFIIFKMYREITKRRNYKQTPYYKYTSYKYSTVQNNKGLDFEKDVFNWLNYTFSKSKVMTNILIPRKGSMNEYSEIDIVFLHATGLYVLELKNYNGYVYGNIENDFWNVGYKDNTDNLSKVYTFLNPIRQNKIHILDLKDHIKENFINYVIFNYTTEINSDIENLSYFDKFVEIVKNKQNVYTELQLKEIENKIKEISIYENIAQHIKRIQFNETKYSKLKRKR